MIDPATAALNAAAMTSPAGLAVVFGAGALTSIGPCIAPRYVAVAALAGSARHPAVTLATFLGGLIFAYVALGSLAGAFSVLWNVSSRIDAILAVGLFAGGLVTIVRATPHARCATKTASAQSHATVSGPFLCGAGSALVISPCCTPIIATIVTVSGSSGRPLFGALLMAAFALGHAAPLFIAGLANARLQHVFARFTASQAPAVVSGSLMISLGCYYGVIA